MTRVSGTDAALFNFTQAVSQTKAGYGKDLEQSFASVMSDSQNQMESSKETMQPKETENVKCAAEKLGNTSKDKISKETKTEETKTDCLNEDVAEKEAEVIEETAKELVTSIAKTLGVSEEELLEAMENLGISLIDLTNPMNMAKLAAAVMEEADGMTLITDENLFTQVKELSGEVAQTMEELAKELGMNVDELTVKVNEAVESFSLKEQMPVETESQQPDVSQTVSEAFGEVENAKEAVETSEEPVNKDNTKETVTLEQVQAEEPSAEKEVHGKQNSHNETNEQAGNSFQQTVATKEVTAATQAETPIFASDIDPESILNQIAERVKIVNKEDFSSMEMQLHPESLGNLQLQVKAKEGIVTAQFTTENEAVKQVLEAQVVQLKEKLEVQGVKVEAVEVMVASHEFERNLEKGSDSEENNYAAKKVTRRKINLNVLEDEEETLDEDEKQAVDIQKDMMRRNGNTLDYMA